jgi:hypothetical protein
MSEAPDPWDRILRCLDAGDPADVRALADAARAAPSAAAAGTVACRAIASGDEAMVRAVLDLGIDPDTRVPIGHERNPVTLASYALRRGQGRIATALVERGGTPSGAGVDDQTFVTVARDVMEQPELDRGALDRIIECAHGGVRSAFVSAAIGAGRTGLAESLIDAGVPLGGTLPYSWEMPLHAAGRCGAVSVIERLVQRGLPVNARDRERRTALHHAIASESLATDARVRTVRVLLRLWAVPELLTDGGLDAYALARERDLPEIQAVLREEGLTHGPRQSREARAAGVRDIRLRYDKAFGFIYRIGEPDQPFLAGGDYDGPQPCSGLAARAAFDAVRELSGRDLAWFEPFLDAVLRGREFGYEELLRHRARFRAYRFDESSNWSRMLP